MRNADGDRYLATLYAPQGRRRALLALYAFNVEIAGIRDRIRESLPGEIRIQWWRDVLSSEDAYAGEGHPVAAALKRTISEHRLPVQPFESYLEARIFDLYDDPMPSRGDLEGYCGETAAALVQLAALVLDPAAAPDFAEAAGYAGCAQAVTGILRLLPLHRARGQCYVPRDILAAAGITPEEFVAGSSPQSDARVVAAMVALAGEHVARFARAAKGMPASLRPAFLATALVPAYLVAVERLGGAATGRVADISSLRRHWLLLRHAGKGWPEPAL